MMFRTSAFFISKDFLSKFHRFDMKLINNHFFIDITNKYNHKNNSNPICNTNYRLIKLIPNNEILIKNNKDDRMTIITSYYNKKFELEYKYKNKYYKDHRIREHKEDEILVLNYDKNVDVKFKTNKYMELLIAYTK